MFDIHLAFQLWEMSSQYDCVQRFSKNSELSSTTKFWLHHVSSDCDATSLFGFSNISDGITLATNGSVHRFWMAYASRNAKWSSSIGIWNSLLEEEGVVMVMPDGISLEHDCGDTGICELVWTLLVISCESSTSSPDNSISLSSPQLELLIDSWSLDLETWWDFSFESIVVVLCWTRFLSVVCQWFFISLSVLPGK